MKLTVKQLFEALQRADKQRQDSQNEAMQRVKGQLQKPVYSAEQNAVAGLHQPNMQKYDTALLATFDLQRLLAGCQLQVEIPPKIEKSITPFVTEPAQSGTSDEGEPDHGEAS